MNIYQWLTFARRIFKRPSLVLMYHRIAQPNTDPWELSISPDYFEQQLQVLKASGLVRPLSHLTKQLNPNKVHQPCIVLTFDDGYADNFLIAKPLLEKYELPASFFICTNQIGKEKEFWWDELAYILLEKPLLPNQLSLEINSIPFYFDLHKEGMLTEEIYCKHKYWKAGYLVPPTHRARLYKKLWQVFSSLSYQEQQDALEKIKNWAGIPNQFRSSYGCMTSAQLQELAYSNLFTIGAHTVSHPALSHHPEAIQRNEITQSKHFLEVLTGLHIDSFAYPSGNYDHTTVDLLRQEGFKLAFTTNRLPVNSKTDPYQISRFQVNNWPKREFERFLFRLY